MAFMDLSIQDTLRYARRKVREQEWHEASLKGPKPEVAPPFEIDDAIFTTDGCPCGYEEGRSEADRLNHKENCLADGDRAWDEFKDSATDAEMAEFVKEQDELYRDSFDMTDMDQEEL